MLEKANTTGTTSVDEMFFGFEFGCNWIPMIRQIEIISILTGHGTAGHETML